MLRARPRCWRRPRPSSAAAVRSGPVRWSSSGSRPRSPGCWAPRHWRRPPFPLKDMAAHPQPRRHATSTIRRATSRRLASSNRPRHPRQSDQAAAPRRVSRSRPTQEACSGQLLPLGSLLRWPGPAFLARRLETGIGLRGHGRQDGERNRRTNTTPSATTSRATRFSRGSTTTEHCSSFASSSGQQ